MNAHDLIKDVIKEKGTIKTVYWVACGGSVIDLYPAHCLINAESTSIDSEVYTAREFKIMAPRKLGSNSLVITCSHSGGTLENYEAAELARDRGAAVIAMTNNAGSRIDNGEWPCWVYEWGNDVPTAQIPSGMSLSLAAELVNEQDGYEDLDTLMAAIGQIDGIVAAARTKSVADMGDRFAHMCKEHDFLYILGSGPNFSQTYGFAICSLMEMQWQNCCYLHSGEYFHGPFECTEDGVFYFLQMGSGRFRPMDERALDFLKTHTDSLMVLDLLDYGMSDVAESVRDYLDPVVTYAINCELRAERGKLFDHDPDVRRYMGKVEY
ncbi:MAG: SIS domain-containing protein [Atopobiaceae bacterium]|jgi:fructoselysine-6-P-deglycase FrlB-like protein|nr:SIS domain-containing protein [Atopobiaceae bacterium]MCI2172638.1 SIS domain-containing protein [Atopobiaceae bacterium]MCI2206945.1 SIS domain-containing protein [Atopobiaceae bacterium]